MPIPTFALHDLGWYGFQQLCHTVLREVLGQEVVPYLHSWDGGRDGSFIGQWHQTPQVGNLAAQGSSLHGQFVFQCKHTSKSGVNLRMQDIKNDLDKAESLAKDGLCDVYVLMTNLGVSGHIASVIESELACRGIDQSLILGSPWFNQTIVESSRLRRLVPRLYGLGDLTQILDERAYEQTRAVLDSMRSDLNKLVLTGTYRKAARSLEKHHFVLLTGAPASGKTTIAAQLALGAADDFGMTVVKIDTPAAFTSVWNTNEDQLFWLDDAFGSTQYNLDTAAEWVKCAPRVQAAITEGGRFILTSRDYIFQHARSDLKPGSFPQLDSSNVVVDVDDLTMIERSEILYNHLKLGRQPNAFLDELRPHLEALASHQGFSPELARRLSNPFFTNNLNPRSLESVNGFFEEPADFLRDTMDGLDANCKAALGLIYLWRGWLPSPIEIDSKVQDFLSRSGSDIGGATKALTAMQDSLVRLTVEEGDHGWKYAHPTMNDSYASLLIQSPELLQHLIDGCSAEVLFSEFTCGEVGVEGAVVLPRKYFPKVAQRLTEECKGAVGWWERGRPYRFLARRCDDHFLNLWAGSNADLIDALRVPKLMLRDCPENRLAARLNELGLLPDEVRKEFAFNLIRVCLEGLDTAALWTDYLWSVFLPGERKVFLQRIEVEMLSDLESLVEAVTEGWRNTAEPDPDETVSQLRQLCLELPSRIPGPTVEAKVDELYGLLDDWVMHQEETASRIASVAIFDDDRSEPRVSDSPPEIRNIFDDLLDGRDRDTLSLPGSAAKSEGG